MLPLGVECAKPRGNVVSYTTFKSHCQVMIDSISHLQYYLVCARIDNHSKS